MQPGHITITRRSRAGGNLGTPTPSTGAHRVAWLMDLAAPVPGGAWHRGWHPRCAPGGVRAGLNARALHIPQFGRTADRKSTRLNSSHLVISYAVFCLKKKKNHTR